MSYKHLCTNIQILMNVLRVHTTVIKGVPTVMAPSPVPVTVDIYCQVMEDHAMVCTHAFQINIALLSSVYT